MRLDVQLPEESRTIFLDPAEVGAPLTQILRNNQLPLNTRCGERALCKSCVIELLVNDEFEPRQGCLLKVDRDMTVRIPQHAMLAYKPQVLSDYRINVPYAHDPLFGREGLAAAIDIGTTTVALSLVDLATGTPLGKAAAFNRQMHYGDDVLTRINLCFSDAQAVPLLQRAITIETLLPLLHEALAQTGETLDRVRGFVMAGNTTMLHLVAGIDPSPMGVAPFTPSFIGSQVLTSGDIGLEPSDVPVHLLPGAAAYVGADITCGVLASGLAYEDGPSLLVDVGTNGEIVLKAGDRMIGCATAAGPAFEGSGLKCGIRAGEGAISHVEISPSSFDVQVEIIGPPTTKAIGICGSAYIDILAEGYRSGLLNHSGRLQAHHSDSVASRLVSSEYGKEFILELGLGKRPIVISEPDIARLLQAKAAIAAGIMTLLSNTGVKASEIKTLYLAGGFGMHLNIVSAIECGLFPGFRFDQIQLVGNTSLAGATLSAVDRSFHDELERIGKQIEIVELNLDPDFEDTYIDQLVLGEP